MIDNHKKSSVMAALTGAALGLPAIAQLAHAAEMPTRTELGYHVSKYQEEDVDASQVLTGSTRRYDIDSHQFRLVTPVAESLSLTVDAMYESMTGASAMSVVAGPAGNPALIMTGASIQESRSDISAQLRRYQQRSSQAFSLGYSTEEDYTALNGSLDLEHSSADANTTWSGGLGFSLDELEPVQQAGINRVTSEDRHFINGYLARARVHSPRWQTQLGLYLGWYDGYLSDPYRLRDIRPDSRQQVALLARSRYYFTTMHAALHCDYRYYTDDWGIESHTLELSWQQNISDALRVSPLVRYYSQSQADFYVESDSGLRSGDQSSDFRLSPYGAIALGLGVEYFQPEYSLSLYLEQYSSDADYALKSVDEPNPFLVDYTLVSLGLDYRF